MNDREVVTLILLITFTVGIIATLLYRATFYTSSIILIQAFLIFLILTRIIRIKERRINRRKAIHGRLSVRVCEEEGEGQIFEGFIVDLSRTGISFCLLNLEKKYIENDFFINKEMELEYKPAGLSYDLEKPFNTISGKVIMREDVAENAVKIMFEFDKPLEEK